MCCFSYAPNQTLNFCASWFAYCNKFLSLLPLRSGDSINTVTSGNYKMTMKYSTTQKVFCFEVFDLGHGLWLCAVFPLNSRVPASELVIGLCSLCVFPPAPKVSARWLHLITSQQCLFATEAVAGSEPTKQRATLGAARATKDDTCHASPSCARVTAFRNFLRVGEQEVMSHVRKASRDTIGRSHTFATFSHGDHEIIESCHFPLPTDGKHHPSLSCYMKAGSANMMVGSCACKQVEGLWFFFLLQLFRYNKCTLLYSIAEA